MMHLRVDWAPVPTAHVQRLFSILRERNPDKSRCHVALVGRGTRVAFLWSYSGGGRRLSAYSTAAVQTKEQSTIRVVRL